MEISLLLLPTTGIKGTRDTMPDLSSYILNSVSLCRVQLPLMAPFYEDICCGFTHLEAHMGAQKGSGRAFLGEHWERGIQ